MNAGIAVPFFIFGSGCWIVTVISNNIRKSNAARAVAALHTRLLDKCAGSQDLIAYLESPAGRRFLESTTTDGASPASRILGAMQAGFILTLVGIAEFASRVAGYGPDGDRTLVLTGAIALAVGLGFLVSAASSFFLSKSWGILRTADQPQ